MRKGPPKQKPQRNAPNSLKNQVRPKTTSSVESAYALALANPFNIRAEGARIPDLYPLPTASYRVKVSTQITTDSNGNISLIINPALTGTVLSQNSIANLVASPVSTGYYSAVPEATVAATACTGRVVSFGARFKNTASFNNISGRIVAAPFTAASFVSGSVADATNSPYGNLLAIYTGDNGGSFNAVNMLGSMEYAMDELIEGECMLISRPVDYSGLTFKKYTTFNALNASYDVGNTSSLYSHATGLTTDTGISESASPIGLNSWVVNCYGLAASANPIELELIFHLETTPLPTNGATALVPANQHVRTVGSRVFDIIAQASNSPLGGLVEALTADTAVSPFIKLGRSMMKGIARGRG